MLLMEMWTPKLRLSAFSDKWILRRLPNILQGSRPGELKTIRHLTNVVFLKVKY